MATKEKTSATQEMSNVVDVLGAFTRLLEEETLALRAADFKIVDTLQAKKREFAKRYHDCVCLLSEKKEYFQSVGLDQKEKLVRARTKFTHALNDNMLALEAAKDSARRLVERILETARHSVVDDKKTNYSSKGQATSYKTATMSLSIDHNL